MLRSLRVFPVRLRGTLLEVALLSRSINTFAVFLDVAEFSFMVAPFFALTTKYVCLFLHSLNKNKSCKTFGYMPI